MVNWIQYDVEGGLQPDDSSVRWSLSCTAGPANIKANCKGLQGALADDGGGRKDHSSHCDAFASVPPCPEPDVLGLLESDTDVLYLPKSDTMCRGVGFPISSIQTEEYLRLAVPLVLESVAAVLASAASLLLSILAQALVAILVLRAVDLLIRRPHRTGIARTHARGVDDASQCRFLDLVSVAPSAHRNVRSRECVRAPVGDGPTPFSRLNTPLQVLAAPPIQSKPLFPPRPSRCRRVRRIASCWTSSGRESSSTVDRKEILIPKS
ncbi:hypothetical protein B0H14DRAFT_2607543 [Mycena olivaceomarginata]|nr:hypothetical protein B0H14DRAFT_2607543 [Mycena olivaceomarginata]